MGYGPAHLEAEPVGDVFDEIGGWFDWPMLSEQDVCGTEHRTAEEWPDWPLPDQQDWDLPASADVDAIEGTCTQAHARASARACTNARVHAQAQPSPRARTRRSMCVQGSVECTCAHTACVRLHTRMHAAAGSLSLRTASGCCHREDGELSVATTQSGGPSPASADHPCVGIERECASMCGCAHTHA